MFLPATIFNAQFPNKNVQANYVMELVRTFEVQNKKYNRTWMITDEEMKIGVLGLLEADCTQFYSIRTLLE